jgi:2-amino-4-hydroxy-6-hydroxymethyldihydropteridine diphosphokinase
MARVEAVSSLYETDAVGPEQPAYYNAVCRLETGLEPESLLRFLKALEHEIGRRPGEPKWGPRPIDLDLLLYGDRVLETADLVIPHAQMAGRAFVLVPLAEIGADVRHPVLGKTITELAAVVGAEGVRQIADIGWDGVAGTETERVRI